MIAAATSNYPSSTPTACTNPSFLKAGLLANNYNTRANGVRGDQQGDRNIHTCQLPTRPRAVIHRNVLLLCLDLEEWELGKAMVHRACGGKELPPRPAREPKSSKGTTW